MQKASLLHKIGRLPLGSFWVFGIKEAWAALFGGLMLFVLVLTAYVDLPLLTRYDWLFIAAILIQVFMLATKLEKPHEVITIVLFHLVGLGMELFKTSGDIGSWSYPGEAFFKLGNVPLFSGFMYAAVGSYMARSWRVFELQFSHYPNRLATAVLAVLIYINFFTHHFTYDIRYILFLGILVLFGPTMVSFTVNQKIRRMPLVVAFVFIAFFIWVAENIGTFVNVWLYPQQIVAWQPVGFEKLGSWLLLMVISFVMVDLLHYFRAKKSKRALP